MTITNSEPAMDDLVDWYRAQYMFYFYLNKSVAKTWAT
jgi:hypothetical protein